MNISSPLLAQLQSTLGIGSGVEIPDGMNLTLDKIPLPVMSVQLNADVDLRGVPHSLISNVVLNQGASSAASFQRICQLDRGVYRIHAQVMGSTFGGTLASSANPYFAGITLVNPGANGQVILCPLGNGTTTGVPQYNSFDHVFQFSVADYNLYWEHLNATGVGQSIGTIATVYIQRLI